MAFKMKGFPLQNGSTNGKSKEKEDVSQINWVDPITGGNNAEYERGYDRLMQMYKDGKITKQQLDTQRQALIDKIKMEQAIEKKNKENPPTYNPKKN